jgi:hypothetical protein
MTPFWPVVASSTSSTSLIGACFSMTRRIFVSSSMRPPLVCRRPRCRRGRSRARLLRVVDRLEGDGCRVLPSCCGARSSLPAFGPRRQLIDGRGAEGVGGADDDGATEALEVLRELADRRRLADAVHSDDEDDGRALGEPERRVELREVLLERLLEHALQVPRIGRAEPRSTFSRARRRCAR